MMDAACEGSPRGAGEGERLRLEGHDIVRRGRAPVFLDRGVGHAPRCRR